MKSILENMVLAILVIWGVFSTICSAILIKYTPAVTIVFVVLELLGLTIYGIWTVVGYGALIFILALIVMGFNMLFIATNSK